MARRIAARCRPLLPLNVTQLYFSEGRDPASSDFARIVSWVGEYW